MVRDFYFPVMTVICCLSTLVECTDCKSLWIRESAEWPKCKRKNQTLQSMLVIIMISSSPKQVQIWSVGTRSKSELIIDILAMFHKFWHHIVAQFSTVEHSRVQDSTV
jgi:hypothetical protein